MHEYNNPVQQCAYACIQPFYSEHKTVQQGMPKKVWIKLQTSNTMLALLYTYTLICITPCDMFTTKAKKLMVPKLGQPTDQLLPYVKYANQK